MIGTLLIRVVAAMTAGSSALSWRVVSTWLITLSLVGCATPGPDQQPFTQKTAKALGLRDSSSVLVATKWWQSFGDAELDQLIAEALAGQPTLALSRARVTRMLALADANQSTIYPQVSFGADVTRQRYTANGLYPPPLAGNVYSSGTAQFGITLVPDLFGQHTAEIASALNQAQAAQADANAAEVSLAAQVCHAYITLARLAAQRDLAQHALAQRQIFLSLITQRVTAGLDTNIEMQEAELTVAQARGQAEMLDEQINLVRHQLAALAGQGVDAYADLNPNLTRLRLEDIPLSLGTDLLGRRADVVAARWRVEAAVQDVQAARTQFYPNINISAFAGVSAIGAGKLFESSSAQAGIGPAIRLPLFDGGRLRAQLKGRQSDLDIAIALYNGVLLDAVKEASDAISSSQSLQRQQQAESKALASAQAAYDTYLARYTAGLTNQLTVLNAESQWLAQRRSAVDLRARELDNRVALMKSLGGGWRDVR
jgi:NodT family efflux transporter outer membrane factor (OMF) lipoprotein